MKLILLTLATGLLLQANATPLLGQNKCTWGPDYWCKNYGSAIKCGGALAAEQLSKCKTEQWTVKPADSIFCDECKKIMQDIESYVNNTRKDCKDKLEKLCSLIPLAAFQTECQTIVNNYYDVIVDDIVKELDSQIICYGLGICQKEMEFAKTMAKIKLAKMTSCYCAEADSITISCVLVIINNRLYTCKGDSSTLRVEFNSSREMEKMHAALIAPIPIMGNIQESDKEDPK